MTLQFVFDRLDVRDSLPVREGKAPMTAEWNQVSNLKIGI